MCILCKFRYNDGDIYLCIYLLFYELYYFNMFNKVEFYDVDSILKYCFIVSNCILLIKKII